MATELNLGYQQRLAELDAMVAEARLSPDSVCERAAGLLAGRIGCRIDEAHAHLRLLASQQRKSVDTVAAEVMVALEARQPTPSQQLLRTADEALRAAHRAPATPAAHSPSSATTEATAYGWADVVQQMLTTMSGNHIAVVPIRNEADEIVDYRIAAASPAMRDLSGRTGLQLIGQRVGDIYADIVGGPVWRAWADTLGDGQPRSVGPFPYRHRTQAAVTEDLLTVQVERVGSGLLNSWVRHDEERHLAERISQTERLGALGWGEWDLVTDQTVWSEGLYRIYERDPADGPLPREESDAMGLPEDEPLRRQAMEAFGRGETIDLTARTRVNGKIKHLRAVIDAVRDTDGRPVKIYGIIQDVTAREISRLKLAEVEQQLREQQQSLAAEHRLAAQLQNIVLPIPQAPIDLPGLQAAIRYVPAEHASRVGGDWYHAAPAGDGSIILAVGDVAGHGLQAAATMAQLRHALAALTITTTSQPAQLLSHLNRLLYATDPIAGTATAVIVRYDPASSAVVWAQAGHHGPLHARAGTVTELPRPAGPLLGAVRRPDYHSATAALAPGDILLLYTDGLIEHRSHTLEEGKAPVRELLSRLTGQHREHLLEDLVANLQRANPDDDTCVLAARRTRVVTSTAEARTGDE